jgi:hypothetical protein
MGREAMMDDDDTQQYEHQRQWVGLTNEERLVLEFTPQGVKRSPIEMSFATEAKLKEKNHV